jgi:hypothetical protein
MTICCKDYLSWYKLHLSAMNYCILWELTSTEVKHLCVCCRSQFMIFCDRVHTFWSIFYIHLWIRFWVNYSPHPRAIRVSIRGLIQFYHSVSWAESYGLHKELCSSSCMYIGFIIWFLSPTLAFQENIQFDFSHGPFSFKYSLMLMVPSLSLPPGILLWILLDEEDDLSRVKRGLPMSAQLTILLLNYPNHILEKILV